MTNLNGKLSHNLIWMFALGTLGLTLLVTKLIPGPITPKAMAAIYFAIVGAGATAGLYLTRASVLASIGAFALVGLGIGLFYYITIARAGGLVGMGLGLVFAVAFAVDAFAAGIAGTLFGLKLRKRLRPMGA